MQFTPCCIALNEVALSIDDKRTTGDLNIGLRKEASTLEGKLRLSQWPMIKDSLVDFNQLMPLLAPFAINIIADVDSYQYNEGELKDVEFNITSDRVDLTVTPADKASEDLTGELFRYTFK